MRIFSCLVAALLATASPSLARTLTMPDDATMTMLRSYLQNDPPAFEDLAASLRTVQSASEFDRSAVTAREVERLRQEYLSMSEVDTIVMRINDRFGEYDGDEGGFNLQSFEPDRHIRFGWNRLTFDNRDHFRLWELPVAEAREVLSATGGSRSVTLEVVARPFASSHSDRHEIRAQVRSVRILSNNGRLLGEMLSSDPEAKILTAGAMPTTTIPDEALDVMGLKVGADYATFGAWASEARLEADTMEEPFIHSIPAGYNFTAKAGGLPKRSTFPSFGVTHYFPAMQIADKDFTCGSDIDSERLCGRVTFSGDESVEDKRILSIAMSQSVVGAKPDQVLTKLSEKYGAHLDSFDVLVQTATGDHRARQYVWGASFPDGAKGTGAISFADQDPNWQIEAVLFEPEVNRTVLLLQLVGAPETGQAGVVQARL